MCCATWWSKGWRAARCSPSVTAHSVSGRRLTRSSPRRVANAAGCTKTGNVLNALPKSLHAKAKAELYEIRMAPTRAQAVAAFDQFLKTYRAKYPKAADKLTRDRDALLAFYDFPAEHRIHLRTTNPIESIFAGVRLRTNVTKRLPNVNNAVYLVFKIIQRLAQHWRKITGSNLCGLVLAGVTFVDGQMAQPLAA